jgi:hypothetical protein
VQLCALQDHILVKKLFILGFGSNFNLSRSMSDCFRLILLLSRSLFLLLTTFRHHSVNEKLRTDLLRVHFSRPIRLNLGKNTLSRTLKLVHLSHEVRECCPVHEHHLVFSAHANVTKKGFHGNVRDVGLAFNV